MSIIVKDYQEFCKIPSGSSAMEYNIEISKLIGLDTSNLTSSQVQDKVSEWLEKLVISKTNHKYIFLDRWYKIDKDLYTLTFNQWIYFTSLMKDKDEKNIYEIIHFLIATFLRPCRIGKFFPKRFNVNKIERVSKLIQDKLDITIALELINFFFHYTGISLQNTKIEYLGKLDRESWEKVVD